MTIGRFFGLFFTAIIVAALGYCVSYRYPFPISPQTASSRRPAQTLPDPSTIIQALGRLEPAAGVLAVGALPGEQIVELKARVGMEVQKGQELAVLGSLEIREAEFRLATQRQETAKAQLDSEMKLGVLRIQAAQLSIEQAKAREKELPPDNLRTVAEKRKTLATERLNRLEQLRNNPATREAITDAELEEQRLLIEQIDAELEQNSGKRDAAESSLKLAGEAAQLDLQMANLTTDGLKEASPLPTLKLTAELAGLVREATKVLAPCNGVILEVYARQGERVANTPILQMADLEKMVCIAEVHEAKLKYIETEYEDGKLVPKNRDYLVTLQSNALKQKLHGRVIEVGRFIGVPALRDPNPLAQADLRTAKVRIELDEDSTEAARDFVNLQVDVTIHLVPPNENEK